jgi:hypothetical protein
MSAWIPFNRKNLVIAWVIATVIGWGSIPAIEDLVIYQMDVGRLSIAYTVALMSTFPMAIPQTIALIPFSRRWIFWPFATAGGGILFSYMVRQAVLQGIIALELNQGLSNGMLFLPQVEIGAAMLGASLLQAVLFPQHFGWLKWLVVKFVDFALVAYGMIYLMFPFLIFLGGFGFRLVFVLTGIILGIINGLVLWSILNNNKEKQASKIITQIEDV